MAGFAIKVKTKNGQQVIRDLTPQTTVKELLSVLSSMSDISVDSLQILFGYPPQILNIVNENYTIDSHGITSGETLILEEKPQKKNELKSINKDYDSPSSTLSNQTESKQDQFQSEMVKSTSDYQSNQPFFGVLMKQVVPADNSCLFKSIYYVLNGKMDATGVATVAMRSLIAETITNDPTNYSEAILGKPVKDYCDWIMDDKSWGGAIEISILSQHYGYEIVVVDTVNAIVNRFGEDRNYENRVLLLFDGIHYDPLYLERAEDGERQTIFPTSRVEILAEAEELAQEAKSSRQFTDTNKFRLKCHECNVFLSGQVQAQQHAQSTGHSSFSEV